MKLISWVGEAKKKCKRDGWIETLVGRRRYFPSINSQERDIRAAAERSAINSIFQGSSADIIKRAMIKIKDRLFLKNYDRRVHLVLEVHDELVYEVPEDLASDVVKIVKESMESAADLRVKLEVKVKKGHSWGNMTQL